MRLTVVRHPRARAATARRPNVVLSGPDRWPPDRRAGLRWTTQRNTAPRPTAGPGGIGRRMWVRSVALVGGGLVAGGILAGTLSANAATDTGTATSADSFTSQEAAAPTGTVDQSQPQRSDEQLLTGDTATKVTDAALAKYPGAMIQRVETDSDGVYEAHLVTAAGDSGHRPGRRGLHRHRHRVARLIGRARPVPDPTGRAHPDSGRPEHRHQELGGRCERPQVPGGQQQIRRPPGGAGIGEEVVEVVAPSCTETDRRRAHRGAGARGTAAGPPAGSTARGRSSRSRRTRWPRTVPGCRGRAGRARPGRRPGTAPPGAPPPRRRRAPDRRPPRSRRARSRRGARRSGRCPTPRPAPARPGAASRRRGGPRPPGRARPPRDP